MAIEDIGKTAESISRIGSVIDKITALFSGIGGGVSKTMAVLGALGLGPLQTKVVIAVLFLISFLVVLKFMKIVTKLLIFGLIVWVVASLTGLI